MSATLLGISREGRTGKFTNDGKRSYERTYRVQTTDKTDDAVIVLRCVGIPRIGFPWVTARESDTDAVCVSLSADQVSGSPYIWEVKAEYSNDKGSGKEPDQNQKPTERPARITFTHVIRQKIWEGAANGQQTNRPDFTGSDFFGPTGFELQGGIGGIKGFGPSNMVEAFDPPVTYDEAIPVLTIQRFETNINTKIVSDFVNKVNSDVFFGFAPRTMKLNNITIDVEIEEFGQRCRNVTYEFHHHPETWDLKILDVGTKYWTNGVNGAGSTLVERNESGEQTKFLLDGKGGKLAAGADAVFLTIKAYKEAVFATLNLPQTL